MIDICVNIHSKQLQGDRENLLARASSAGIAGIVLCATDLQMVEANIALCNKNETTIHPQLRTTAGVHPHDASTWSEDSSARLIQFAGNPWVCAIGECGLDYNRNFSTETQQLRAFEAQIEVARVVNKPLFVHDRDSRGKALKLLTRTTLPATVIHCFTGSEDDLRGFLEAGFYIGITGWICDQKRGAALRDLVKHIPLEKLLIETDAPFLRPQNAPVSFASDHGIAAKWKKRNEPALLAWVVQEIAKNRHESAEEISHACSTNAQLLFAFPT